MAQCSSSVEMSPGRPESERLMRVYPVLLQELGGFGVDPLAASSALTGPFLQQSASSQP